MASDVRYRYKGKFISEHKARALSHLPSTKKYVTHEYPVKGKADAIRQGYQKPMQKLLADAMAKGRRQAEYKRQDKARAEARPKSYREQKREIDRKLDKKIQDSKILSFARDIATRASQYDESIEDAADYVVSHDSTAASFVPEYYEEVSGAAQGIIDYGEEAYDFDMEDLEQETERIS